MWSDKPSRRYQAIKGWYDSSIGRTTWNILDWDQRRLISVAMDEHVDKEALPISILEKYADNLCPGTQAILVDVESGVLLAESDWIGDDHTECPTYFPIEEFVPDGRDIKLMRRTELMEVRRLGPGVDLVEVMSGSGAGDGRSDTTKMDTTTQTMTPPGTPKETTFTRMPNLRESTSKHATSSKSNGPERQLVFKYLIHPTHLHNFHRELSIWSRLPPHPSIVPLHSLVVEEDESAGRPLVVGFTSAYVPGGSVLENVGRTFKLRYLHQLTEVLDVMNLEWGLQHQDVAGRNLLVDAEADRVMLFDFDWAARIPPRRPGARGGEDGAEMTGEEGEEGGGDPNFEPCRDDVKAAIFTLYEVITRDFGFRRAGQGWADYEDDAVVLGMERWERHPEVSLDAPVEEYRRVLGEWVRRRRGGGEADVEVKVEVNLPGVISWTPLAELPKVKVQTVTEDGEAVECLRSPYATVRREEVAAGRRVVEWERPASKRLRAGERVRADGQLVQPRGKVRDMIRRLEEAALAAAGSKVKSARLGGRGGGAEGGLESPPLTPGMVELEEVNVDVGVLGDLGDLDVMPDADVDMEIWVDE